MTVGDRIREMRERVGMTQVALADKVSVKKQTLYKYENGTITNIPIDKVELIAEALGTTPSYLMGWEDKNGQPIGAHPDRLSSKYYDLTPDNRAVIDDLIDRLLKSQSND